MIEDRRVHNALAHLYGAKLLGREQHADQYLYVSVPDGAGQLEKRYEAIQRAHEQGSAGVPEISDQTRESMDWLLSVLNEKQRRLYLGLESMRLGHGGDVKISRLTGVNVKTIALGRRQLQERTRVHQGQESARSFMQRDRNIEALRSLQMELHHSPELNTPKCRFIYAQPLSPCGLEVRHTFHR